MLLLACSPPSLPDAGPPDSGPTQQHCVASSCGAGGTWRVLYSGDAGSVLCQPVEKQIVLTSDGVQVCMLKGADGGSDGGCSFEFEVPFARGTDLWSLDIPDAGHMYGTWTTQVPGSCTATLSLHGIR